MTTETTSQVQSLTITLHRFDQTMMQAMQRKRVYAQPYGDFFVLRTMHLLTISTKEQPFIPLVFDGEHILCFSSSEAAQQFISFFMAQKRPTFLHWIARGWPWRLTCRGNSR